MAKKIKVTVSTSWDNVDHVDYWGLPSNWDEFPDKEKRKYLNEWEIAYLHEVCESFAEVVDEEDE